MNYVGFSNTGSMNSQGTKYYENESVASAIPAGYTLLFCFPRNTGDNGFSIFELSWDVANKTVNFAVCNLGSTADSGTPRLWVVSIKTTSA